MRKRCTTDRPRGSIGKVENNPAIFTGWETVEYDKKELKAMYVYLNYSDNMGALRRTFAFELLGKKQHALLNYNPRATPRACVAQLVVPQVHGRVKAALHDLKIELLPETYNPLGLSPRNRSLCQRRASQEEEHLMNIQNMWERTAENHRSQGVAEIFEELAHKAADRLTEKKQPERVLGPRKFLLKYEPRWRTRLAKLRRERVE